MADPAALDPDMAAVLARLEADGWMPLTRGDVALDRQRYRDLGAARGSADDLPVATVHDDVVFGRRSIETSTPIGELVPGSGPDTDVEVRVYGPDAPSPTTVVWLHGGGWMLGDLDTADAAARRVCRALGARVVSVHYRRAPEHPHPAALQDAHAVLRWAAAAYPGARLVVGGDSAGGGLAAGAALLCRDWGPRLDAQLLFYPGLDPTMGLPSVAENADGPFLTADDMRRFWSAYLPDPAARADPTVALLEAAKGAGAGDGLVDLAPAVIATAALDPLRDEGEAYADALAAAGVTVRLRRAAGLPHGFLGFAAAVPAALAEVERALAEVRLLLEP